MNVYLKSWKDRLNCQIKLTLSTFLKTSIIKNVKSFDNIRRKRLEAYLAKNNATGARRGAFTNLFQYIPLPPPGWVVK